MEVDSDLPDSSLMTLADMKDWACAAMMMGYEFFMREAPDGRWFQIDCDRWALLYWWAGHRPEDHEGHGFLVKPAEFTEDEIPF